MKTITKQQQVHNFINGKFESNGHDFLDVMSPLDGSIISSLPLSTYNDVDAAVNSLIAQGESACLTCKRS